MSAGQPSGFVQAWITDPDTLAKDPEVLEAIRQSTDGQNLGEALLLKRLLALAQVRAETPDGN